MEGEVVFMAYETVLYQVDGGVATISLNRPDKLNSFTRQMHQDLMAALKEAEKDQNVRCVVLTGAGRGFCAGQDLDEAMAISQGKSETRLGDVVRKAYNPLITKLATMEKPVLAAINGVAAGAGASLAMACDLRIASDKASFSLAFVKIGLVPDSGASYFLPRLVGLTKAMELCLLGDKIDAAEAERIGLVNKTVPDAEFAATVQAWAQRLAQGPRSMGLIKRQLRHQDLDLAGMLEYEAYQQEIAGTSEDAAEGIRSFLEKRAPRYTGR
jgi:2-(1,2-epoxy-1,2-dihydrophenyl)acetyl-CoA isomerase